MVERERNLEEKETGKEKGNVKHKRRKKGNERVS